MFKYVIAFIVVLGLFVLLQKGCNHAGDAFERRRQQRWDRWDGRGERREKHREERDGRRRERRDRFDFQRDERRVEPAPNPPSPEPDRHRRRRDRRRRRFVSLEEKCRSKTRTNPAIA